MIVLAALLVPCLLSFDVEARGPAALVAREASVRLAPGRHHVELAACDRVRVAVDGGRTRVLPARPSLRGPARRSALLATGTALADRLTHRLAALHAAAPAGRAVRGTDRDGDLRLTRDWMAGFWPSALYRAADRHPRPFRRWAERATTALAGGETADTHDLGFLYGRPAIACGCRPQPALRAAAHMAAMLRRSPSGLLPTSERRCRDCQPGQREAIIDSLPNVELLAWSGRAELAVAHARKLVAALVRPDGSTAQAVHFDAATGALGAVHTHQGLSPHSTWARGQGWALYGLAALSFDPELHGAAERVAAFIHARLGGVPRWDFDATSGPTDASALAVIAAGLARLAEVDAGTELALRHRALARTLLDRLDATIAARPPIGRFAGQVYTYGGPDWDENAEFILGVDFALEALARLA